MNTSKLVIPYHSSDRYPISLWISHNLVALLLLSMQIVKTAIFHKPLQRFGTYRWIVLDTKEWKNAFSYFYLCCKGY